MRIIESRGWTSVHSPGVQDYGFMKCPARQVPHANACPDTGFLTSAHEYARQDL